MAYPETDVIILCFSVVRPDSMDNVVTKWLPELNKFIPGVIIVLVGTQCDLREPSKTNELGVSGGGGSGATVDPKQRHISTREGEELRQKIKAYKYIECSAITQCNINEVFNTCVEAYARVTAQNNNRMRNASCFHSLLTQLASSIRRRFSFRHHNQLEHENNRRESSGGGGSSTSKSSSKKSSKKQRAHES